MSSVAASAASSASQGGWPGLSEVGDSSTNWRDEALRKPVASGIRLGKPSITGQLPIEVVQRVVRQSFGRFRQCYEIALAADATLSGRTATSFTIDTAGDAKDPKTTGDFKDKDMLACVQEKFAMLSFPPPESGTVKVLFPIVFAPTQYSFTINGKPSAKVEEVDVVKALEGASYKVTSAATFPYTVETIPRLQAEKGGVTFTLTLDPAAKLPVDIYKQLKTEAVLLQDGAWCLFVESSNKTASQMLVNAIHKKLPAK